MLKKNKRWKIKWREEEKNMGLVKKEEIKLNKIFPEEKKLPFTNIENLTLDKKSNSDYDAISHKNCIKGLSSSFSVKKKQILRTEVLKA